jgi:hypothetical protein
MTAKVFLTIVFVGLSMAGFGCDFGSPTPPDPRLTENQVEDVLECQETIKKEGRKFTGLKTKKFEKCLDEVLALQLESENELITEDDFEEDLEDIREECTEMFEDIEEASTDFVDEVIKACKPVEDIIFSDYDPLQFEAMGGEFTDVEELAGVLCSAKELFVDLNVFVQVPRMVDLLNILGEDFFFGNETFPGIPLDDRCEGIFFPLL